MLFVRASLPCVIVPSLTTSYTLFVKVALPAGSGTPGHTLLGVAYRRDADPRSFEMIATAAAKAVMLGLPVLLVW